MSHNDARHTDTPELPDMALTNGLYAAYSRHGKIHIEDLKSYGTGLGPSILPLPDSPGHVVLALSRQQPHLLAVSSSSHVLIYDILAGQLQRTILGNGRVVTAIAWSASETNLLWTGAVDGSISLWDLECPAKPLTLAWADGCCRIIESFPAAPKALVTANDGKISLFRQVSRRSLRIVRNIKLGTNEAVSMSWSAFESGQLLIGCSTGRISLCDLSATLDSATDLNGSLGSDSSDGEDAFFGDLDGIGGAEPQILQMPLLKGLTQLQWVSRSTFLTLNDHGMRCSLWDLQPSGQEATELWSQNYSRSVDFVYIFGRDGSTYVIGMTSHGTLEVMIPQAVLDGTGLDKTGNHDKSAKALDITTSTLPLELSRVYGMKPSSIPELRAVRNGFPKTSKQLRSRKPSFERSRKKMSGFKTQPGTSAPRGPSPPPPTSMTSSLELPKQRGEENSPMPFLSPSIPSQQPSPGQLSQLDDETKLPPLPRASFDSLQSASATAESDDSDDETFVDAMQGSASFLPGGINVPLPKACAALFTPTGELLTFFPPKPQAQPSRADAQQGKQADPKAGAKKVARLFPSFGNLAGEPELLLDDDSEADSGFESSGSMSGDEGPLRLRPSFTFDPSAFPRKQSWKDRISPTKHSFTEQSPHKVIVSLHDVGDVGALLPSSRKLASQYRILCDTDESGADLCLRNAEAAADFGLNHVAGIWRLMALLLDGQVPLDAITGGRLGEDILVVAQAASELLQDDMQKVPLKDQRRRTSGKLRWIYNPLGAFWIVRAVFDWAESQADIQLLAILSAILAEVQEQLPQSSFLGDQSMTSQLPLFQEDYFSADNALVRPRRLTNQSIPILRTDSIGTSDAVHESPVKLQRSSTASSRNASNPSTPYHESNSSTPPLSLPALERQSTRLSISGSSSPEHHRSSFSAAAKYYAQSISDKFAAYGAYGTSPPGRKTGASPSTVNELSTSLPSGSWGKSVSFASTANTTKTSFLSTSYEDEQEDEGYDSDKTVEDTSQPQTLRDSGDCVVVLKNDRLFDDDISGGSRMSLLPEDLVEKARLWCQHYADQLRCWDLLIEAVQLEKVCGMTRLRRPSEQNYDDESDIGVEPVVVPHASKACAICSIRMTGVQFFCPACSHGAHLSCLEDFARAISSGDEQQDFECPTGCGCRCDDLPFSVEELAEFEIAKEIVEKPKKKASFTDPRRWRARVEGDSW